MIRLCLVTQELGSTGGTASLTRLFQEHALGHGWTVTHLYLDHSRKFSMETATHQSGRVSYVGLGYIPGPTAEL